MRAVVLTGAGDRAFCAGADMKGGSGVERARILGHAAPGGFGGIALRETLDVPVIARVNGHALGGGFEMVLGCDIVSPPKTRRFGLPEARVGRLPLDGGMTLLQRQMPFKQAMGVLLTGRRIKAAEALAMGLVNEVVPRADLDAAVDRWLADILACAPLSVRAIKQVVRRTAHLTAGGGPGAAPAGARRGAAIGGFARRRARLRREAQARMEGTLSPCPMSSPTPAST